MTTTVKQKKTSKTSQNQTKFTSIKIEEHLWTTGLGNKKLMKTTWCKINWWKQSLESN